MIVDFVGSSISFCRPGVVTDAAIISKVVLVVHVLYVSLLAPEPLRASVAFEVYLGREGLPPIEEARGGKNPMDLYCSFFELS
jgi:hypothetical protein